MEREKGFESQVDPGFSRLQLTSQGDEEGSTRPADASVRAPTRLHGGDDPALPAPTPDLFITAGATVADLLSRGAADRLAVEQTLRRAVDQASALRMSA